MAEKAMKIGLKFVGEVMPKGRTAKAVGRAASAKPDGAPAGRIRPTGCGFFGNQEKQLKRTRRKSGAKANSSLKNKMTFNLLRL
jgi:hypothetical protein